MYFVASNYPPSEQASSNSLHMAFIGDKRPQTKHMRKSEVKGIKKMRWKTPSQSNRTIHGKRKLKRNAQWFSTINFVAHLPLSVAPPSAPRQCFDGFPEMAESFGVSGDRILPCESKQETCEDILRWISLKRKKEKEINSFKERSQRISRWGKRKNIFKTYTCDKYCWRRMSSFCSVGFVFQLCDCVYISRNDKKWALVT